MAPAAPMKFTDRRRGTPQRTVGKHVEYVRPAEGEKGPRGWVSTPIRLYVGPRKAARA